MLIPHVTSEYGVIRHVAMRYASDVTPDFDGPDVHPVLTRQKATSSWKPCDPAAVRTQQDTLVGLLRSRGVEVGDGDVGEAAVAALDEVLEASRRGDDDLGA
ncbi:hypothetical protein AB0454_43200, partial [Streptomyces sp. NPDC093509]